MATSAEIAQLGERKTEDLKVTGSIPVFGMRFESECHGLSFFHFIFLLVFMEEPLLMKA